MLFAAQTTDAGKFVNPQWIVTPLPAGRHLLVLSGVVIIDFWSRQASWHRESLSISPDRDLALVIASAGVPPAPQGFAIRFLAEQYSTFGGMNSIFDQDTAVNAGFAVDAFKPTFDFGTRLLNGIQLDIAVRDSDAALLRVGYHLTAVGRFVQIAIPPIL